MKHIDPFDFYSEQLLDRLQRSKKQKNRGLWLYQNDLRTPAFMIQSLCRLFDYELNDVSFKSYHKVIKKLEGILGQIDFYDVLYKEFNKNKKISAEIKKYALGKRDKEVKKLDKFLKKKGGIESRIKEFNKKIASKVKFDHHTINKIETALVKELETIKEYERANKNFKSIEEVHKLRRELRWISIYGQSFCGIIKLEGSGRKEAWEKKYVTKSVITLSFNKLPHHNFPAYIMFSKNNFFALSWMIQELGKLKDKGLNLKFLIKAIRKTENLKEETALKKAKSDLNVKGGEADIIKQVKRICETFFVKHKVLDGLIIKPRKQKQK
ncbi:MAG TPA: hypothetical protein VN026_04495 [Bacteroidia bacterium]|jgi:hypothetical protein|nr:hypothetical protein [Bacteroidia bacterium]